MREPEQLLNMTENGQITVPIAFRKQFPHVHQLAVRQRGDTLILEPRVSVRPGDEWVHGRAWEARVDAAEADIEQRGTRSYDPDQSSR